MAKFEQLGLKKTEMFTYKAADGKTTLYGTISFPSNFDPSKKYPALASVYGGPGSAVTNENFAAPEPTAEYGFLMLQLGSRSAPGQGRRVLDAAYINWASPKWMTWRSASKRCGTGLTLTKRASESTERRTAATAPRCRSCDIRMSGPLRRRLRR